MKRPNTTRVDAARQADSSRADDEPARAQPTAGVFGRAIRVTAGQVKASPLAAAAGAAAISAGLALVLPFSRREALIMGEVADKLGEVAREAADGAVALGLDQVESLSHAALASVGGAVVQAVIADDREARASATS
jgi:hypothetical protein